MRRDGQTDAQLVALADAADRANRPRMLVIVLALLAGAALVLVVAQSFRFLGARSLLEQRLTEARTVERFAERTRELRDREIDLASLFPDNPSMADQMQSLANEITEAPPGRRITVDVIRRNRAVFQGDPSLQSATVRSTFQSVTTEQLFEWMERVQRLEGLDGAFVTEFSINPVEPGRWRGQVEFRMFVYRENAR
jgi:hypothetical protein